MEKKLDLSICGEVKPGFEAVRAAFADNFARRGELGAACCIYYRGEKVVDLWGGVRDRASGAPWEADTMTLVFSTTKGMSGLALALAHSRGWLDYEQRVCAYWPEFAQAGKERITVRQLLAHQAGLPVLDEPVDRTVVADLDRLAQALARQKPAWEPGTRQGYHAISLGFYEGELLRRVDPRHRSLGQFFQDEIATPLGLDFYIRLPEEISNARLAVIQQFNAADMLLQPETIPFLLVFMNPHSLIRRAMTQNPGTGVPFDAQRIYSRNLEVPSAGGVGTARAIARAYSAFATGGSELGLRAETLQALMAPAVAPRDGFYDVCLRRKIAFSLGFLKPWPGRPYASPAAFGAPGAGGSFGFADPHSGVGYAYVMNRMSTHQGGDPRDVALREAFYRAIGKSFPAQGPVEVKKAPLALG